MEIIEETRGDGFTRRLVHLPSEAGGVTPAYVLIPDADRRNGRTIITPHGHGMRWKTVAGVAEPPRPRGNQVGPFVGNYTEQLAKLGFVTACWNERGFDERNDSPDGRHYCTEMDLALRQFGYTLIRMHLSDLHRVADYVSTLDGVNPDSIGLTGLSGGATLSWLAGAFDDRFAAIAPFCGLFRTVDHLFSGGCGMQDILNVYPIGDTPEILSLIAPRPLMIAQGRLDATFNIIRARGIYHDAMRAWKAAGKQDHLKLHLYNKAHQVDIAAGAEFFMTHLEPYRE